MDYKELAEMCRYLSDTPSYTAFHDEVEREVICDSCKGGLCYEKVQDAHWCMYEALQRAATAITDLLARAEAAEKRVEELEKSLSDAAQVVKTMQESTIPFYERRAEKAQRERDAAIKQLREFTESVDRPCACCKHDTGDYVALDVCGGCSPENDKWEWDGGRDKK